MDVLAQTYKINDIAFKRPDVFKIERYNLTSLQRLASGDMCGDLIAKKLKFYFTYNAITSDQLENILNLIWTAEGLFFPLTYVDNNELKTAQVYVGSIPSELVRTGAKWVWKNVTFSLIQK